MPDWLRALIAGYSAKKLGGGCFSTILIFVVIYFALGQCNHPVRHASVAPGPAMRLLQNSTTVSHLAMARFTQGK